MGEDKINIKILISVLKMSKDKIESETGSKKKK